MSEEYEIAVCEAMEKMAAPGMFSAHEARIFRLGFLAGQLYEKDQYIAQLNEKLERLK